MEADEAADGAEPDGAAVRQTGDGFDEVVGSAIANAVRRAVDGVGRDPVGALAPPPDAAPTPPEVEALPVETPAPPPLPPTDIVDPYELLGISRRAAWDDITAAYKSRARAWHPDGAPADEQPRRHELIRALNAAYAELRVRRGR